MVRPHDMKPPYAKDKPVVLIDDAVWYIPDGADLTAFTFQGWKTLFGNDNPVYIEYCSGNGEWLAHKALSFPHINWLAVEKRFDRVRKIWSKIHNLQLSNAIATYADALILAAHYIPKHSVECIYVNFPDPWPKRRHERHRIISAYFFEQTATLLKTNGKVIFTTDDLQYSQWFIQHAMASPLFTPASKLPQPLPYNYGDSFFSSLFHAQQRERFYHELLYTPSL